MKDFDFVAPTTVEELIAARAKHGASSRLLAGGTDLIVQLREGQRDARVVVDVKRVKELREISTGADGSVLLGAAASCASIWRDERIHAAAPSLGDAARIIGAWQIQSRASVGGNLCNASPAADSAPALLVEEAVALIAGPGGRRELPVSKFCVAPGRNALADDELLIALRLPAPAPRSGSAYLRFIPRNEMDIAVVGAGAWIQLDAAGQRVLAARIALGAVAPTPVLAEEAAQSLVGAPLDDASLQRAGELARKSAHPISDHRGPAGFRRHLVGVLVTRALVHAARRARGGSRAPILPGDPPARALA